MTGPDLDAAVLEFRQKQRRTTVVLFVVVTVALVATISILAYLSHKSRQAEARAEAQKEQLDQLAAQAHLRWDMRTERPLDPVEILQGISGNTQKEVIGAAILLYKQNPPIPFTWGGKSPETGFDSSGFIAYPLAQAGILKNPGVYWSGRLRQFLKPIPIEEKLPGDVVFYPDGVCMFYLGGPDDLSIGMVPGGIVSGKFDLFQMPEAVGRY